MTTSLSQLSQFKEKLQLSSSAKTISAKTHSGSENIPPKSESVLPRPGHSDLFIPRHIDRQKVVQQPSASVCASPLTLAASTSTKASDGGSSVVSGSKFITPLSSLPVSSNTKFLINSNQRPLLSKVAASSSLRRPIRFDPNALLEDSDSDDDSEVDGCSARVSHATQLSKTNKVIPSLHQKEHTSACRQPDQRSKLQYPENRHGLLKTHHVSPPLANQQIAGVRHDTPKSEVVHPPYATSKSGTLECDSHQSHAMATTGLSMSSNPPGTPMACLDQNLVKTVAEPTPVASRVTGNHDRPPSQNIVPGYSCQNSLEEIVHHGHPVALQQAVKSASDCEIFSKMTPITVHGKPYIQLLPIGKGGCGKVYRGLSPSLELVAIKHVDIGELAGIEDRDEVRESCLNEIAVLEQLQHSNHIVKLLNWELSADQLHIHMIMECGEYDLASFMSRQLRYLPYYVDALWMQMLSCVQAIHEQRIVHSDLKPANFVFFSGLLKLIDFGIAAKLVGDVTSIARDSRIGTPNYMAPECIKAKNSLCKANPKSDVWSLGCILYRMIYKKTPFHQFTDPIAKFCAIVDDRQEIPFPPISSTSTLSVLKKCLTRDLSQRASVSELMSFPLDFAGRQMSQEPAGNVLPATSASSIHTQTSVATSGITASLSYRTATVTQTLPQSNDGNNRSVTVPHARPPPASRDTENSGIRTTLRRCGTAPGATLSKNEGPSLPASLPISSRLPLQPTSQNDVLQFLSSLERKDRSQ